MKLTARIAQLEARQPQSVHPAHLLYQLDGETEDFARRRYERDTGKRIGPDDMAIILVPLTGTPGTWQ